MTSIFENTKSKVTVHILHDQTLTEDNRKKFIRTAEKYSQGLELHDVTEHAEKLPAKLKASTRHLTPGTLYRLFTHEVIDLDKVILLDCDIVVNLDIKELWDIDTEGKALAGVNLYPECNINFIWGSQLRLMGIDLKNYLNVGVLVMNLQKIRARDDFLSEASEYLMKHIAIMEIPDEIAFNVIFAGDIKFIDKKFNRYELDKDLSDCIVHLFPGKPWLFFTGKPHEIMYWSMYAKSAWGENITPAEIVEAVAKVARSQDITRVFGKRSVLIAAFKVCRKIFRIISSPLVIISLIVGDIYSRIKYRLTRR